MRTAHAIDTDTLASLVEGAVLPLPRIVFYVRRVLLLCLRYGIFFFVSHVCDFLCVSDRGAQLTAGSCTERTPIYWCTNALKLRYFRGNLPLVFVQGFYINVLLHIFCIFLLDERMRKGHHHNLRITCVVDCCGGWAEFSMHVGLWRRNNAARLMPVRCVN